LADDRSVRIIVISAVSRTLVLAARWPFRDAPAPRKVDVPAVPVLRRAGVVSGGVA